MSSRGTKFGRKLCLAGFYHCWDYCLPRSLPVPLVGLVGWCQCGKWGSSDLGVLLMAFFTLSVVCSVTQDTSHMVGLSVHLLPQSCPRCCSFLLHDSTALWLAEVLHFQAWSFSPSYAWGNTLLFTRRLQNCGDRSVYTTDSTRPAGGCWPQQLKIRQNFSKLDFGFIFLNFIYWLYSYF